jgi:hypothetical protein
LSSDIKEYSFQRIKDKMPHDSPKTRWILNLSWDRGSSTGMGLVKCGESLFFDSFTEMAKFINQHIDPDI